MTQQRRTIHGRERHARPHFLDSGFQTARFLAFCLICCSCALGDSSARPGTTDPHGLPSQRMLFRDDQLLLAFPQEPFSTEDIFKLYQANHTVTGLTDISPVSGAAGSGPNSVAVAGRYLSEANDQLAYLHSNQGNLVLQMLQAPPGSSDPTAPPPVFSRTFLDYAGPQTYLQYPELLVEPRVASISFDAQYNPVVGPEEVVGFENGAPINGSKEISGVSATGPSLNQVKVELVSGLFKFSPTPVAETDFNFGRSELALAFNNRSGVVLHPFSVYKGTLSDLLTTTLPYLQLDDLGFTNDFTLATGGFGGVANAKAQNPLWSLALSSWSQ